MKIFSKTIAVVLSAFMILTCAVPVAHAAQNVPCPQIKVICCDGTDCGGLNGLVDKLCNSCGTCMNDMLKTACNICPSQNGCVVCIPDACVQQPSVTPAEPAPKPVEPTEAPTAPAAVPTEAPTEAPTKAPTEPVVKPTEPAVPAQPITTEFNTAYEAQVLSLVNAQRANYGLAPLTLDEGAAKVAHLRAKEIVQSFSHTRPDGRSCFSAAQDLGVSYRTAGENIAYGYATPEQVVNGWMNSEGHRRNILSASYSKIGIGCYESRGVLYWSQFFIG